MVIDANSASVTRKVRLMSVRNVLARCLVTGITVMISALSVVGVAHTAASASGLVTDQLTNHPDGSQVVQGSFNQVTTPDRRFAAFTTAEQFSAADNDGTHDEDILDRETNTYDIASRDAYGVNLGGAVYGGIDVTSDALRWSRSRQTRSSTSVFAVRKATHVQQRLWKVVVRYEEEDDK